MNTTFTNLINTLNITVNSAKVLLKKYGYTADSLTDDIVDYIVRQETGVTQETLPQNPTGVSYLELASDQTQAMTLYSLAKTFDFDPNNIPENEVETLLAMLSEGQIVEQANNFLDESERALVASQTTEIKLKVQTAQDIASLAADITFKAGKAAYNRRMLELMSDSIGEFQDNSETLQTELFEALKQSTPAYSVQGYQQKLMTDTDRFNSKKSKRLALIQRLGTNNK